MPRQEALVTPTVLQWARKRAGFDLDYAAKKVNTTVERLRLWEDGKARPTIRQAQDLASVYRQPFAAFYLAEPPEETLHLPRDYRRHAGTALEYISPLIRVDVGRAWERRAIVLELLEARDERPPNFVPSIAISDDPEKAGRRLRTQLGVTEEEQAHWRDNRIAFNAWRTAVEQLGVLALQSADIPLQDCRAYSLFATSLPVIVVNRKDVYPARTFSLLHELAHLALRTEGLCDLTTRVERAPEVQRVEVFCNAVAAACVMPVDSFLRHWAIVSHSDSPEWEDNEIDSLARDFVVSREAVLRRLLTHELTTESFYERMRTRYQREYESRPKEAGFLSPPINAVSILGKPFVRMVLDGFEAGHITSSDVSDYLGVRLKHLSVIASAVEAE